MLDSKQMGTGNKFGVKPIENQPKKPSIDRKKLLEKLKSRINKRKQSLPYCYPEKVTRKVRFIEPKRIEIPCSKPSMYVQPVIQNLSPESLRQIIPKSVEDIGFRINTKVSKVSTNVCIENIEISFHQILVAIFFCSSLQSKIYQKTMK